DKAAFNGGDDFLGSARERLFGFSNGQTGTANPNAQGFVHLVKDGVASSDASAGDTAMIDAQRNGGDLLHVFGAIHTHTAPCPARLAVPPALTTAPRDYVGPDGARRRACGARIPAAAHSEPADALHCSMQAGRKRVTPLGGAGRPEVRNLAADDANYLEAG